MRLREPAIKFLLRLSAFEVLTFASFLRRSRSSPAVDIFGFLLDADSRVRSASTLLWRDFASLCKLDGFLFHDSSLGDRLATIAAVLIGAARLTVPPFADSVTAGHWFEHD